MKGRNRHAPNMRTDDFFRQLSNDAQAHYGLDFL